ncbi:RNA recognition motif 2-domain-containing protein [Pisolithus orientalis]|uniref:RNA recognition motif 2-domain-containing protein n=1 Tax=Pisolithus orientalis TaxID=936130 RepID=UPI002225B6C7|nr:RNA recognition motif 2-domain-containing protein [Pisolithus orientalis]KAI6032954.1 RNA recognition motif 2-domain-containing protein [Pisolithus orientalis]
MSASQHALKEKFPRPPRLQPSPSLPNLRGGKIPPVPSATHSRPNPHKSMSHLSFASTDSKPKTMVRGNRPRKPSNTQHYLTPPLTPSSSLKSQSTNPESTNLTTSTQDQSTSVMTFGNVQQSRILIIGNVPSELPEDVITQYLCGLTASKSDPYSAPPASQQAQAPSTANTGIQTVDFRFRDRHLVVVAFYDVRDADKVNRLAAGNGLSSQVEVCGKVKAPSENPLGRSWQEGLTYLFVDPSHLRLLLGAPVPGIVTRTEGTFYVLVSDVLAGRENEPSASFTSQNHAFCEIKLRDALSRYGNIRTFRPAEQKCEEDSRLFVVEYFDIRDAEQALENIDGQVIDNMKLRPVLRSSLLGQDGGIQAIRSEEPSSGSEVHLADDCTAEPKTTTTTSPSSPPQLAGAPFAFPNDNSSTDRGCNHKRPSINPSYSFPQSNKHCSLLPEHLLSHRPEKYDDLRCPGPLHERVCTVTAIQPDRRFDAAQRRPPTMSADSREGTHLIPVPIEHSSHDVTNLQGTLHLDSQTQYGHRLLSQPDPPASDASMQTPWMSSLSHSNIHTQHPLAPHSAGSPMCWNPLTGNWVAWPTHNLVPEQWPVYPHPSIFYPGPSPPGMHYSYMQQQSSPTSVPSYPSTINRTFVPLLTTSPRACPENNQLDIEKIEQGVDTRTTVMIKNIPNKMTDKELLEFINNVCPRRVDFLYLRMDFKNGCNVGYAFVNFISVQDLLLFAKKKLNERWNMYSSEKILQMSYANYQGKEALVEKFKNSCIMDEREEWRPKIFYSEPGANQGLPEEFPKPTHIRRKERSSFNRGALFVPGISTNQRSCLTGNSAQQNQFQHQGTERRLRRVHNGGKNHADGGSSG